MRPNLNIVNFHSLYYSKMVGFDYTAKSAFWERGVLVVEYFDANKIDAFGVHPSQTLLHGTNGARMGVSLVAGEDYGKEEAHTDQEGLFFVEGHGMMKLDGQEYPITPNTYVLMPAHTKHCFKKSPESPISAPGKGNN